MKQLDGFFNMVPLDDGLTKKDLRKLVDSLPDTDMEYIPFYRFGISNSAALGFISVDLYDYYVLNPRCMNKIDSVLNEWENESDDKIYSIDDKYYIYIGCEFETCLSNEQKTDDHTSPDLISEEKMIKGYIPNETPTPCVLKEEEKGALFNDKRDEEIGKRFIAKEGFYPKDFPHIEPGDMFEIKMYLEFSMYLVTNLTSQSEKYIPLKSNQLKKIIDEEATRTMLSREKQKEDLG